MKKKMMSLVAVVLLVVSIIGTVPVSAMLPNEKEGVTEADFSNTDGFTYDTIYANLAENKINGYISAQDENGNLLPNSEDTITFKLHRLTWDGLEMLGVTLKDDKTYAKDKLSTLMGYCDTILRSNPMVSDTYTGELGSFGYKSTNKSVLVQVFNYYISIISAGESGVFIHDWILMDSTEEEAYFYSKQGTQDALFANFYAIDYNFARLRKAITKKQKALNAKDIWKKRFKYTSADKKILKIVPTDKLLGWNEDFFYYSNVGKLKNRNKLVKKTFDKIIKIVNGCKTIEELNKVLNILETFDYQYKEFKKQVYDNFDAAWDKGINNPDEVEAYMMETMRW